jgi:hypothetical protein
MKCKNMIHIQFYNYHTHKLPRRGCVAGRWGLLGLKFFCYFLAQICDFWKAESSLQIINRLYKSLICIDACVGEVGQTAPKNPCEPPLQILCVVVMGIMCRRFVTWVIMLCRH